MRETMAVTVKLLTLTLLAITMNTSVLNAEVNSGNVGLMAHGGVGTGQSMFGIIYNTSSNSQLGSGKANAVDLGLLANYRFLALGVGFTWANLDTLKWDEEVSGTTYDFESRGSGHFWTMDLTLGFKVFTETGDMGYTSLFGGLRVWNAERVQDKRYRNDVLISSIRGTSEMAGAGWIAGIRDFSTLPLGLFSLVLQSGLWVYQAPMTVLKYNGTAVNTNNEQTLGFGVELGIGAAFESIGTSAIVGVKMDMTATQFKTPPPIVIDAIAGAGYVQFFLVLKKEFSL